MDLNIESLKGTLKTWAKQYPTTAKSLKYLTMLCSALYARKICIKLFRKFRHYPPGPVGIPFFGCFWNVGIYPFYFFTYIAQQYGDIVSVPLFWNSSIYINDPKLVHEIFRDSKLNNRFIANNPLRKIAAFDLTNGPEWKKRRRFLHTSLVDLTKTSFIVENMKKSFHNHIYQIFESNENYLWYPRQSIAFNSLNMIFSSMFGVQFNYKNDTKFAETYIDAINTRFRSATLVLLIDVAFKIKLPDYIMWDILSPHRKNEKRMDEILLGWMNKNGFAIDMEKEIIQRTDDIHNNNKVNLYIDIAMDAWKRNNFSFQEMMSDTQALIGNTIDTTTITLEHAVLLLAKYPDVQQQIVYEIKDVMKQHNVTEFNFKILHELHIFRAFIWEVLRISCAVPGGVGHTLFEDMPIKLSNGKTIMLSKGDTIHYNVYYIMKKILWGNTKQIVPNIYEFENNDIHLEYWLDSKTKKFVKNDNFVGFGSGKRNCPGQNLAIKSIYAFLGLLLTKYKFVAQNNDPNSIDIKHQWGMVMTIEKEIPVRVQKRTA
eukprot:523114_1